VDLLDRVLIVSTKPYTEEDIQQIIQIRSALMFYLIHLLILIQLHSCEEEDVTLTQEAQSVLTSMATSTTLRYALNLISCAQVIARKRKSDAVDVEDLRRAYTYFMDEKRSVQWLKEQQGSLVFEEVGQEDAAIGDAMES